MGRILTRPRTPVAAQLLRQSQVRPNGKLRLRRLHPLYNRIIACLDCGQQIGVPKELRHGYTVASASGAHLWQRSLYGDSLDSESGGYTMTSEAMQFTNPTGQITAIVLKYNPGDVGSNWQYIYDARNAGGTWVQITNGNEINAFSTSVSFTDHKDYGVVGVAAAKSAAGAFVTGRNFTKKTQAYNFNASASGGVGFGSGTTILRPYNNDTVYCLRGQLLFYIVLDVALSRLQVNDIWVDPWQFFEDANDRVFLYSAAAPPATGDDNAILMGSNF